jgi:putative hydrolase of the HAD superfamily
MVRAILFDMGGTLDGDGQHWLDRFVDGYADAGIDLSRETIRKGFDRAEQRLSQDADIVHAGFDALVRRHLAVQFDVHGLDDAALLERMAARFVAPIYDAGRRNVALMSTLRDRGLLLGVVSNACGNARVLCDDLGYGPFLSAIVDSRVVGVAKPDPRIYTIALDALGLEPASVMMVGDNYERDIVPPHDLGMQTTWLVADAANRDRGVADACIAHLSDLLLHLPLPERAPA